MADKPIGRKKNVGTGGSGVHRRGEALGTGPVGNPDGYSSEGKTPGVGTPQRSGGRSPLFMIIVILILVLGGGGGLTSFLGGGDSYTTEETAQPEFSNTTSQTTTGSGVSSTSSTGSALSTLSQLFGGYSAYSGGSSSSAAWSEPANTGKLNTAVDENARPKRTTILGDGEDVITIMVYMCGADLESRSAMATNSTKTKNGLC